ncbi:YadA-like family protein [Xylella fastidiosa subsp. morus]|uniref:YadA-like family protein n=1 Tax=Xylella fastidiosa TaxID=2371 RepID=UPI001F46A348|nr:YadA-like family protein [Xylella fastidiosa]UIN27675.1 YadA-like family protein [Xylella fastidiosa subsp. morus]UIT35798.1 YadA-like family protein [Xylella fastidiosa subsp. morus]UIT38090.1 YadA-like family protein [Xylella fastidiosa subsp. morus]UIT42473.1 YadA-like family protein [Xylella fastidiosa subsp. morus]
MQIHTALPMVRWGGIEGVDPLFLPKYKIGRSLQHAVMTSAASSKKGTQPRRSNNAMTAKRSAKPHDRRQLHIVLLTVLAASTGYTGKVAAQVYVNSDSTENCVEILGDSSQTSFIHSASNDKCKPDFTQTEYSLFYDYRNLVLGGSLYVNEGKLGLVDISGATYSMRLGSIATMNGSAGIDSIAIGSGQGSKTDGNTSGATVAQGLRSIAIGTTARSQSQDAISIGTGASTTGNFAIAIGNGALTSIANGIALGASSSVTTRGGVALGQGSLAATASGITGYDPVTKTTSTLSTSIWRSTLGAVSIGNITSSTSQTRQLTGLAAGRSDTDAVNVAQLKLLAESVGGGWNLTASGANSSNVALGESVDLKNSDGNLLITKATDSNDVTFNLATALKVDSLTTGNTAMTTDGVTVGKRVTLDSTGLVIAEGPSVISSGINAAGQKIINVGTGTADTDAVNFGQLQAVSDTASKGWNLLASGTNSSNVAPGASVDLKNSDGNLLITKTTDSNDVTFNLATALEVDSLTTGNTAMTTDGVAVGSNVKLGSTGLVITDGPSVTSSGISAGNQKITNVAAGTADTDAVNFSQLQAVSSTASKGWNLLASGANSSNVAPGGSVDLKNSDGNLLITKTTDSNDVTFNLATALEVDSLTTGNTAMTTDGVAVGSNVKLGSTGLVITDGPSVTSSGISAGNQKITNVAAGTADTDAVNFSQLQAVSSTASKGWNLLASGANSSNVAPGESVDLKNTDGNIVISKESGSNDVLFNLSSSLKLDKLTVGDTVMTTNGVTVGSGVTLGSMGLVITDGPSVTSSGINAGSQKITNVAAGTADTDAVNLSQLNTAMASSGAKSVHYYSTYDGGTQGGNYNGDGATGTGSIAVGVGTLASAEGATAMGSGAAASGKGSTAIGRNAVASADGSVALGDGAKDGARGAESYTGKYSGVQNNTVGTVSVGDASKGETRTVSNVADAKEATDAVNLRQLDQVAQDANRYVDNKIESLSEGQTFVKVNSVNNSATPIAAGVDATAIGVGATASGADSIAMGNKASASADNAVAIGNHSVADRANTVSVGSAGSERQVTNVAAGTADTDAVNVSQLNQGLITAKQYTDGVVGSLRRDTDGGVAAAIATANLPQAYIPGRGMTSVGVSSYRGQSAIAVGVSSVSESGRWVFKFSGSANTRSQVGIGAGVGYQW